ncbi:MAG TPA: hypothetical protein DEP84_18085 [Chloroflexi bacterium]|nr:hypothetical protein [Chloroflexota bacterium]
MLRRSNRWRVQLFSVMGATYTAGGALASLTLLNGTRTDYRYYNEPGIDQSQRLQQLTVTKDGTPLLDLTYGYDAVSNLTGLTDATPGRAERLTLAYDAFNRLRTVSGATDSASYTYDRLDRLASVTEGGYSTIFGVWTTGTEANTPGQPRHAPRYIGNPGNQFAYDPAGNMTTRWLKQGTSYIRYTQAFNPDNRLSQVTGNGATLTYDLDAQTGTTIRRSQTSGGSTTTTDFVLHYYQKNVTTGEVTKYYYFGEQRVLQRVGATGLSYLHSDHLGSPALLTSSSGTVQTRYRFTPYGRQREGSPTTDRRFTGQRWEASSFLYDYQARHYDPALGLFVSPDPIVPEPGQPAALNRFAYGYNNPLKFTDPTGHMLVCGTQAASAECNGGTYYAGYSVLDRRPELKAYLQEAMDPKHFLEPIGQWIAGGVIGSVAEEAVGLVATAMRLPSIRLGRPQPQPREAPAPCSFSADTLVTTENGGQAISTFKPGDRVLAYDEALKTTRPYTVTAVLVHTDAIIEHLTIDGEQIETTPEHPFLTLERGWVPAGELWAGAHVRQTDAGYGVVQAIEAESRSQPMYNLTVDTAHTFFVGKQGVLVHNSCPGDRLPLYRGGKTQGILDTGTEQIDLISGRQGPAASMPDDTPGMRKGFYIRDHVEAHAAAVMRQGGLMEADRYINKTPCPGVLGCDAMLRHMLPEDATLRVHIKHGLNDWETRI